MAQCLKCIRHTGVGKKRPAQILCHNSTQRNTIALTFGRNTTSTTLNSNWYNLVLMLQYTVFWKPLYI